MRNKGKLLVLAAAVLMGFGAQADVVTNIVADMTFMDQAMVLQNNNSGLWANHSAFAEGGPDARMMGYSGASKKGLVYTTLSALGMGPIQEGTYTLTMQVARNNTSDWLGMIDTDTGGSFNLGSAGFAGGFFLSADSQDRVAYTLQNMDNFNNIAGVSVTVTSDPASNVLNSGASLTEDTWYDVVYTWTVDETATFALGKDAYIGTGGMIQGTSSSLWIANSQLTFIPEPATVGLLGIASLTVVLVRRMKRF